MMFRSHIAAATLAGIAAPFIMEHFGVMFSLNATLIITTAVIAGGIFPDTDTASKPSRIYAFLLVGFLTAFLIKDVPLGYFAIMVYPFLFAKVWSHRKWTHSWLLPVIIAATPYIYAIIVINIELSKEIMYKLAMIYENYSTAFFAFSVGLLCHLFLDLGIIKKTIRSIGGEKLINKLY